MTANQVAANALGDLKSAPSFGISGTTVDGQGAPGSMRLEYKHGTGCEGTVGWGSKGSLYLVLIGGTAWEKPNDAYWKAYEGKSAAQVIEAGPARRSTVPRSGSDPAPTPPAAPG